MSEPQNEYENDHETDAEPTPGPWQADVDYQSNETPLIIAHTKPEGNAYIVAEVNQNGLLEGDWKANARLIAAAGTAVQEAKEMGYDAQKTVEALPTLLREIEHALEILGVPASSEARINDTRQILEDALASAEGSDHE
jgi:hypothetical protein